MTVINEAEKLVDSARGGWIPRGLLGPTSDELSHLAQAHDWCFVEVSLGGVSDKVTLMRALAQQFRLPDEFGSNWDALADALWDIGGETAGVILRLKGLGEIPHRLADPLSEILDERVGHGPKPLVLVSDPPLPTFVAADHSGDVENAIDHSEADGAR